MTAWIKKILRVISWTIFTFFAVNQIFFSAIAALYLKNKSLTDNFIDAFQKVWAISNAALLPLSVAVFVALERKNLLPRIPLRGETFCNKLKSTFIKWTLYGLGIAISLLIILFMLFQEKMFFVVPIVGVYLTLSFVLILLRKVHL